MPHAKPSPRSRIVPALVYMQTHLDEDLCLDLLANEAGLSKFHFHELFQEVTGETPKRYVDRLRLEHAALQLRIRQSRVLDIALECGYRNHETFTRAFRKHFGMSPREYRGDWPHFLPERSSLNVSIDESHLSPTRVVPLARMIVGFIRFHGAYESVATTAFAQLSQWARARGMNSQQQILLGIAHDAPGITHASRKRFDCCVQVPSVFEARGEVACQRTPGGLHAVTDYAGPWNLKRVYNTIFDRLGRDSSIEIIGLPAIEFYLADGWKQDKSVKLTIAIPVRRKR